MLASGVVGTDDTRVTLLPADRGASLPVADDDDPKSQRVAEVFAAAKQVLPKDKIAEALGDLRYTALRPDRWAAAPSDAIRTYHAADPPRHSPSANPHRHPAPKRSPSTSC